MMKDKIIARLKALYPGVNLSKERLNAIADKLEPKITDENLIDEKLNDLNDIYAFSDIAKQDDRLRTAEKKQVAEQNQETPEQKAAKEANVETDPVKQLLNEFKELRLELNGLKAEKAQQTIAQKFEGHEKLKEIPKVFLKGRIPQKEEDIDSIAEEIAKDYADFRTEHKLEVFGKDMPKPGTPNNAAVAKVDPDVVAGAKLRHPIKT